MSDEKLSSTPRSHCRCCGSDAIGEYGNWEICDFCGWEDDPVQADNPNYAGGANRESLNEARSRIRR
ncbi:MAG: hypothetical protein EOO77_07190 [Oxalobacteraceae bacterium]|nr:MAG: hypothetical protein EOO77_07190 [Oxalobacteraceae bacterium]